MSRAIARTAFMATCLCTLSAGPVQASTWVPMPPTVCHATSGEAPVCDVSRMLPGAPLPGAMWSGATPSGETLPGRRSRTKRPGATRPGRIPGPELEYHRWLELLQAWAGLSLFGD